MTRSPHRDANGRVSRADLLRLLAVAKRSSLMLDDDGESWFGYVQREVAAQPEPDLVLPESPPLAAPPQVAPTRRRRPLQMPFVQAIVQRQTMQSELEEQREVGPITPADAASRTQGKPQVGFEDLVPRARLLPSLRRGLAATRRAGLDIPRLIKHLAEGEVPRQLPRRRWRRWHPDLVVVLDFCHRLWPYREDMHRLAEQLLQLCGRSSPSLRIFNGGPAGPWCDWVAEQSFSTSGVARRWQMPPAGTPVLIVSDLGLLLPHNESERADWTAFIEQLRGARLRPLALVPLGAEQIDSVLAQLLPVVRWSPDANLRPVRGSAIPQPQPAGMDALLAMVAATRRVDPPLLRAMRHLNPTAPLNAGLEGALWCHPHVDAGTAACIRSAQQQSHLDHFASMLSRLHLPLHHQRRLYHAHLRSALEHEEVLWWATYADAAAVQQAGKEVAAAEQFMRKIRETAAGAAVTPEEKQRWLQVAKRIVDRAETSVAMLEKYADVLQPLREVITGYRGDRHAPLQCWLVCDVPSGKILLQAQPAGEQQYVLGAALSMDARGLILRPYATDKSPLTVRLVSRGELPVVVGDAGDRRSVQLKTSLDSITLGPIRRPLGARRYYCDENGIHIDGPQLRNGSAEFRSSWLQATVPQGMSGREGTEPAFLPVEEVSDASGKAGEWSFRSGVHPVSTRVSDRAFFGLDSFGLFADLLIETRRGSATQRFRYIEPGTFWMGSPEDELERYSDEGPRHEARLTQGFWLADTACTQALWSAVMGSNPSEFKGEQLPVENVSWEDVQQFLRALEKLLPECHADFPTEAEWEYACRAGTPTPFSFGHNITPAQVNYDGNHPYADGEKGEFRGRTVPVGSLPANAWGLYEMHGNVWEWCADELRQYTDEAVVDPVGPVPDKAAHRTLRGGSWIRGGRSVRSAFRIAYSPGFRLDNFGFRFCLRSTRSSLVPTRPGGPASPRAERAPVPDRAPAGAPLKKRRERLFKKW